MNIKEKIKLLSQKNFSFDEIQQTPNAKNINYVKKILKDNRSSLRKRCWESINLWRIISLLAIPSLLLTVIFFRFPYESNIFLEKVHLKQPEKVEIKLDRVNEEGRRLHIPPFLEELNLNNSKLEGFTIKSPENNSVRLNNIQFWIKPKKLGKTGIIFIKRIHVPRETHISTENIRYFDNNTKNPVKYTPFEDINPGNLQEKYKEIDNKILIGAEEFDLQIDYLTPGEFVSFVIYYIPDPRLNDNDVVSMDDFYWDVCYEYINYGKLIPNNCLYNTKIINSSEGRTIDYMISTKILW